LAGGWIDGLAFRTLKSAVPNPAATPEEDLNQLERDVHQIKIEYEVYLGGGRRRPPSDLEWRIEQTIKHYSERGSRLKAGQSFRFNGLVQTYVKFREIYRKRIQHREEGSVPRHFGAAARQVEELRKQREKSAQLTPVVSARIALGASTDSARESMKTRKLYEEFRGAKQRAGESTRDLTLERFRDFVSRKAKELRDAAGDSTVEFVVANEGGRVRLKARVRQAEDKSGDSQ
jgi:hypothetical protein